MGRTLIGHVLILIVTLGYVSGYPFGAPFGTCVVMFPKHHVLPQTTDCPFTMSANQTEYLPGDVITVTVRSTSAQMIKGIHIRARPSFGDTEQLVGQFISWPENKTKSYDCLGGTQNMVTHSNSIPTSEVDLTWKAPDEAVGDIQIVASFVLDLATMWIDQSLRLSSKIIVKVEPVETVSPSFQFVDWSMCGKDKGCFLYPQTCTGYDCYAAITYKTINGTIEFEMFGREQGYISVAFSDDKYMGDDETVDCAVSDTGVSLHRGYNHPLYNEKQQKAGLTNLEVLHVDGRLFCRFTRPIEMSVYVNYGHTDKRSFNLSDGHYLMLAWGQLHAGSDVMSIHKELPVVTHAKVNLRDNRIVRGSSLPLVSQIHGTLVLVAWILMAGIVTVLPRYFRHGVCGKTIIGVKAWFQVHRAVAVCVWVLTAASFALIFIVFKRIAETSGPHSYIGIAVMAACTLQVLAGMLRPGLESKFRRVFNIGHWLIGKLTHIAAAVTLFFAYEQDVIPAPQRRFGYTVLGVWLGHQLLWELFLEVYQRCHTDKHEKYAISYGTHKGELSIEHPETSQADDGSKTGNTVLFFLYVIGLLAIVGAAVSSIFLF